MKRIKIIIIIMRRGYRIFLARIDDVKAKSHSLAFKILVFYLLSRSDINRLNFDCVTQTFC